MSNSRDYKLEAFGALLDVLDELRIKCPWDAKQTNESLRPNTIEEAMELADALINNSVSDIEKELGDVLLHIIFYAKIADEKGQFDIADVCDALRKKLIFRHPHVFGTTHVDNTDQVLQNWEQLKLKEKGGNKSVLAGDLNYKDGDERRLAKSIGKVDLLKVGHHGYFGSTSFVWAKALSPDYSIVCNSARAIYPDVKFKLKNIAKSKIIATADTNGVTVTFSDNGIDIKTNIM